MLPDTDTHIIIRRNGEMPGFRRQAAVGIVEDGITGLIAIFGNQQIIVSKYTPLVGQIVSQQTGIMTG
ncbi:hypothetical protein BQ6471_00002 [Vibrio gazogenes]|nr:hypothetical protein BQ6471_00002 [Vibrio gazogenes]